MKTKKRRKRLRRLCVAIALLLIMPAVCQAETITIGIKARVGGVQDPMGYLGGAISQDDYVTGYYVFDSLTPDTNPSSIYGGYQHDAQPFGMWVSANGLTFGTNPSSVGFRIGIVNNSDQPIPYDSYIVSAVTSGGSLLPLPNGTVVNEMFWQLDDFTATALSGDALPVTAPLLEAWNNGNYLYISGGPRETKFSIGASVTETWVIPEPATILLVACSLLFRRRLAK